MYRLLVLEDNQARIEYISSIYTHAQIVKTAPEAIELLASQSEWTEVFLDHDLGGEAFVNSAREDCGMEVVRWIVKNQPQIAAITVHTANRPASDTMCAVLRAAGYNVNQRPFGGAFDPRMP